MIQNESRLFVQPGQCAIYTDQGAIKDIITEPGMYFMDTSAQSLFQVNIFKGLGATLLEGLKRIAYEGEAIQKQVVYFVNLTEKVGIPFQSYQPVIFRDPNWGAMEVGFAGNYTFKIVNPVNLITNASSNKEIFYVQEIEEYLSNTLLAELSVAVGNAQVSFDELSAKLNEISVNVVNGLNTKFMTIGIEVSKVIVSSIEVSEEVKKAMRERTGIKMKATSVNNEEADIYTKLNTAEAIKDMANNQNSNGSTILGMNLGNTIAGIVNGNIKNDKDDK
jgi:membrane protease subunit (stomatin/prohibitin family)